MNERERSGQHARRSAEAVYRWLLRIYPRAFRKAFGESILQTFRDYYRDAVEAERTSAARFWLGVAADEGKSLLREHFAALAGRTAPMKPSRLIALAVGSLLLLAYGSAELQHPSAGMGLASVLVIPLYVAVFFLLARLVPVAPRDGAWSAWWRLATLLGGIVSLYVVALMVMGVLIPLPVPFAQDPGDFRYSLAQVWLLSLPLLAGVVGIIGGATTGNEQTGALLGVLTGFLGLVAWFASQALLIVLLWNALQHHQLQSSLAVDYQNWLQWPRRAPTLESFVYWDLFGDGVALMVISSVVILAVQGVAAALGAAFGAGAFRRAAHVAESVVPPPAPRVPARLRRLPITFILTMLGLGVLTWGLYAGFSLAGMGAFSVAALGATLASPAFVAWLLAGLAVVVAVLATAGLAPRQQEGHAATTNIG